ncbi:MULTISPECIES: acyl-CoA dehydrogenase family protein [Comamonas]|uniref:Acyl-CoA dehydrogenase fadE12 n=1 Tax=Comamonas testosteroni TaxID=285 RepID=A0A8B4S399_COMTE|nr:MULTISPECIES: acyl-CoA dehydrogenase family protein [Comamonas]EHN64484.1 acyl-CoA dehydrogenase [Comamonas testosteroni ATCC 11996]QQN69785.1 acyl-CoA dehydrogenase family protein [Comamonas testosteroni]RDI09949.1 acyl-CoA dehydrogenase [Comamonas sp. AG1104]SUY76468.1 Acyl-CoA dehydrogenase fadE12 [Comamonas testosteroni]
MKMQESEINEAFRAEVREWMAQHLTGKFAPLKHASGLGAEGYDAELAKEWEQELAKGGWTGLGWEPRYGGRNAPLAQQVIFHEEYVRCGGPGRIGHIGETLLAPTLMAFGTPEQKQRFLPGILAGTDYWAQGYSEPGAGSDLAGIRTKAHRDAATGEWVINGQKVWTSWAHESEWVFVLARTDETGASTAGPRHAGMVLLLVPIKQAGVEVRPIRQITGTSEFNEVFFDGARTEGALHLGPVGDGWKVAMYLLGCERGASTLGQQAHFRYELDLIIDLAKRNGAARDPLIRQRLAKADMGLQTLRAHALRSSDESTPLRVASVSKYAWSNWHRDLGELAMDVLGEQGELVLKEPALAALQQLWLVSRADTIYAGTNEIQLNLMAERALGMPR